LRSAGSEWTANFTPSIPLREGKLAEARQSVQKMSPDHPYRKLSETCLDPRSPELDKIAQQVETTALKDPDPENKYYVGSLLAMCGQRDIALHLLKSSIEHNYCAYSALQADPALAKLHGTPECWRSC